MLFMFLTFLTLHFCFETFRKRSLYIVITSQCKIHQAYRPVKITNFYYFKENAVTLVEKTRGVWGGSSAGKIHRDEGLSSDLGTRIKSGYSVPVCKLSAGEVLEGRA